MRKTKKLTVCAMLSALGVAILYLGNFMEILDLSVSCAASLIVVFCMEELGTKYSLATYAVISVLSFILLPQKWISVYFILFFGIMPITKHVYEKTGKLFAWILKIVTFNIEIFLFYFVAEKLDFFEQSESSLPYLLALLAMANVVFILADVLYDKLSVIYRLKYQSRIRKFLK